MRRIRDAVRDRGGSIVDDLHAVVTIEYFRTRNVCLEVYRLVGNPIYTVSLCRSPSRHNMFRVKIFNDYRGAVQSVVQNTTRRATISYQTDSGITVTYKDLYDGVSFTCIVDADQYQLATEFITNIVNSVLNVLH